MKSKYANWYKKAYAFLGNKCAQCGSEENLHIRRSINGSGIKVRNHRDKPWKEVEQYLLGCHLKCEKCLGDRIVHGWKLYNLHKCRCWKCRDSIAKRNSALRRKLRANRRFEAYFVWPGQTCTGCKSINGFNKVICCPCNTWRAIGEQAKIKVVICDGRVAKR